MKGIQCGFAQFRGCRCCHRGFLIAEAKIERSMRVLECQGKRPLAHFRRSKLRVRCVRIRGAGNDAAKALVAASRMSYYEISETGA